MIKRALLLLLLALLLALCAAAAAQYDCVTGVAEIAGPDIHLSACSTAGPVWHSNHRTVLAASLVTSGTEVALLCTYADNAAEVRLERYSLEDGSYRDGVALARSAALAPPTALCLTTYDVYTIEADGSLAHYSRLDGSAKSIASETGGGALVITALACTNTRMFGVANGSIIAEFDPEDALALRIVARLPAVAALSIHAPTVLQVQLGEPPVFVLLLDFDSLSVYSMNRVSYSVSTTDSAAAACVVSTLDAVHGVISVSATQYWAPCAQLSAEFVVGEDTVWAVQRGSGLPSAIGGELGNNGNLGPLVAAHAAMNSVVGAQPQLTVVDEDGRVGVVQLSGCAGAVFVRHAHSLVATPPQQQRVVVYELNNASLLWGAGSTQYVRTAGIDCADVELPPLGGAVFDGTVIDGDTPCFLLASQVHCVNSETRAVSADIPLTTQMKAAVQTLNLVNDGRDVVAIYADSHRRVQAVRHNGVEWQRPCIARISSGPAYDVQVVDGAGNGNYVLRTAADELRELFLQNCTSSSPKATLSTSAVTLSAARTANAVALLYSSAAAAGGHGGGSKKQQCLFAARKHNKPSAAIVPLVIGALAMCCCATALLAVCIIWALDVHKTSQDRTRFSASSRRQRFGSGSCCADLRISATDDKAKNLVFLACCCWPWARQRIRAWQDENTFAKLGDDEDSNGASLSTFTSAGGGGGSGGSLSLLADTDTPSHSDARPVSPAAAAALAAAAAVAGSSSDTVGHMEHVDLTAH